MGRSIALSPPRRLMVDLLYFASKVPSIPMQRTMVVDGIASARGEVGWCAIFIKAFAIVCSRHPELRCSFVGGRIYQHDATIACVAIARTDGTYFTHVRIPEVKSLRRIDRHLRLCTVRPLQDFSLFRRALAMARLPKLFRRLLLWWGLNSGERRERYFGTFCISVTAGYGAAALHQLTPYGIALNYGVMDNGKLEVRLMYDHRIWDGAFIATMLVELESVLHHEILGELRNDHLPARGRRSNVSVLYRSQGDAGRKLEERR